MNPRKTILLRQLAVVLLSLFLSASVFAESAEDESDDQDTAKATSGQDRDAAAKAASGSADPGTMTEAEKQAEIAKAATDPSAVLTQLGFFFWTESSSDNKNIANTGLFQPVLPLTKKNVLRPALPVINTGGPDGKFGIGDLFLLDVQINQIASGSWGWGGVASLPTATDKTLGSGKWEAGPMGMYINKKALADSHSIFGILLYNQWSFAGKSDRQDVNFLSFQPIFVHHTSWGYLGWTDINATVDWENDNRFSFPVGLRIGKVFPGKTPFNAYIQPYYIFNNKGKDDVWGIKLSGTFIKPNWLKH
jgi:hypothetical protein